MTDPDRPLLAEIKRETAALAADLRAMLALRYELARRELLADVHTCRRFAWRAGLATVMAVTALPLLAVAAAWHLGGLWRITAGGWLVIFALVLLSGAAVLGWFAWRRFRRELVALTESLEECREDLVWLREWTGT